MVDDASYGVIKAIYNQAKGKPFLTKENKPYVRVVITRNNADEIYTVFGESGMWKQMFDVEKLIVGDNVKYMTETKGQYTNLVTCFRNKNPAPVQTMQATEQPDKSTYFKERDEGIERMAEEKLMLGYRTLAFDMLKASLAYCKDVKFQNEDDFIRQHLFDIETLANKLRRPAEVGKIEEETVEFPEEKVN